MGQEYLYVALALAAIATTIAAVALLSRRRPDDSESPFAASSEGMTRCPKCGRGNLWTDARCIYCGRALPEAPVRRG